MHKLPTFVDMAKSPAEMKEDSPRSVPCDDYPQPIYPWGLSICLTNDELDKLDLDADCDVGDMIHLFALAKVTSVSKNEMEQNGERITNKRIELQITHIALENENLENEEADDEEEEEKSMKRVVRSPYK